MCRKMLSILMLSISTLVLTACSHVAGNVVPDDGPTMESIYDDLGDNPASANPGAMVFMGDQRSSMNAAKVALSSGSCLSASVESPIFSLLDNPPLKVYVFPHFAGSEMLPIPGYWTAFSAYSRTYYALPLTADRGNSASKLRGAAMRQLFSFLGGQSTVKPPIVSIADIERGYQKHPSLVDYLPWQDMDEKNNVFLLEDQPQSGGGF